VIYKGDYTVWLNRRVATNIAVSLAFEPLCDSPSQGSFLDAMIPAGDVRPHERRRDNAHDGNSDDPEDDVSMVMVDRPHVVEVHAEVSGEQSERQEQDRAQR